MSVSRALLLQCAMFLLVAANSYTLSANDANLRASLGSLRAVGPLAVGHREAVAAARSASQASPIELPTILTAMDGVNPVAENWIRGVAEAVAQRATEN